MEACGWFLLKRDLGVVVDSALLLALGSDLYTSGAKFTSFLQGGQTSCLIQLLFSSLKEITADIKEVQSVSHVIGSSGRLSLVVAQSIS